MTTTPPRPAPVDPAGLDASLLEFGESTMLPAGAYTDPAVLEWERRNFFAASWMCLGRTEDLASSGDGTPLTQRCVTVGDVAVLLTFATGLGAFAAGPSEGPPSAPTAPSQEVAVQAFANTCRHRGHELLPEGGTGTKRAVVCPYHAWTYDLDGDVVVAPRFSEVPDFDPAGYSLARLPLTTWHGWVFVNATGDAAPFDEHVGELERLVAPYRPEMLVRRARHTYEIAANWKIVGENYHECYHCPLIHPELCQVSPPTSGDNYDLPGAWLGGSMDLEPDAQTMSLSGRSDGIPIPGVNPRKVEYLHLFPNLLLSLHPDYVMTHRLLPLAPDLTWIECSWYFPSADVDPTYAVDFWDLTNRQDWNACESVQRGLRSPHFRPGPLAPGEDAVHQWVRMVGRGYRGTPAHLA